MKSIWLENNTLSLREVQSPQNEGEALVRIRLAGICGTDLELVKGYYPFTGIPGHEFVGEVVSQPGNDQSMVGRRVVGEINASCGRCEQCQNGRQTHCENRTVLGIARRDGIFAEYTSLPVKNLHLVPDEIPDEMAVLTEPLAAAAEILEQVHLHPSDRVLLIGAGRLGQLIAQTLALSGAALRVVARHPLQKQLLQNQHIQLIDEEDIQPWRWDVVVEATGSTDGFSLARKAIRPRGTLVLKSTYKGDITVNLSSIVVDEINIVGSRCGPFEPALRLMQQKLVDPSIINTREYRLEDGLQAFETAGQRGVLKVLLRP
jgi:threonine dehydrogenase-like Zn-dependent dehydrogenase